MKENNMKKNKVLFLLAVLSTGVYMSGFTQTTTNNNTITINGDVYYFKPSTSPSSPLPKVTYSSSWIGDGEWWGADAAKAWASIVDWTVLHCYWKDSLYYDKSDYDVYINRITAKRTGNSNRAEIKIYFWIGAKRAKMEEGIPASQVWKVEF
jgi:hypothetical protein